MMHRRSVLALLGCASLAACAGPTFEFAKNSDLVAANYAAADRLVSGSSRPLPKDAPIIVATLVKLDNLGESSSLGRLVSEQLASRLTQRGYAVPELKLRGSIFIRASQGELLLSRDVQQIAISHRAQAVVVGTYAIGADYVYVNVKLVDSATGHAISAHDYLLPMIAQVKALLNLKSQ